MTTPPGKSASTADATLTRAGPVLIVLAYLFMLRWTWLRWPDVLVDFGRELYVPWQLAQGKVLFRDLAWFNGPFSPYLNSLWFRIFGPSVRTLALCNAALAALFLVVLYRLFLRLGGRISATIACLLATTLFVFGNILDKGSYCFISPYSHELTHGVMVSVLSLLFLSLGLARAPGRVGAATIVPSRLCLALSGLALGVVLLTKIEVIVSLVPALAAGVALHLRAERPRRRTALSLAGLILGAAAVPPLLSIALFLTALPAGEAVRATLGAFRFVFAPGVGALPLYKDGMGTTQPGQSVLSLLRWTLAYAVIFVPAAFVGWRPCPARRVRLLYFMAYAVLIAGMFFFWWERARWKEVERPLPLVLLIIVSWTGWRLLRSETKQEADLLRLNVTLFALLLLAKMILNTRLFGYGFALALPATLVAAAALIDWAPDALSRRGGWGGLVRWAALLVVAGLTVVHLVPIGVWLRQKSYPVASGPNRFYADARGFWVNKALSALSAQLAPDQTLLVLPEGVMLNFLTGRQNPTPYVNFMPPELLMFGEGRILASIQAHPPDFVAVVHREAPEYGLPFFGRDFGSALYAWVRQCYRPVWLLGQPPLVDHQFGILLLRYAPEGRSGGGPNDWVDD
jgi:hypothetical protein